MFDRVNRLSTPGQEAGFGVGAGIVGVVVAEAAVLINLYPDEADGDVLKTPSVYNLSGVFQVLPSSPLE